MNAIFFPFLKDSNPEPSISYERADEEIEFLSHDELRAVRLQLEWFKPEMVQQEDLRLFHYAETAQDVWDFIVEYHRSFPTP